MASFAVKVVTRLATLALFKDNLEKAGSEGQANWLETLDLASFTLSGNVLDEVALALIVLAVPFSYIVGMMAQCCCGVTRESNMEMDKVDKIYTDVWTTPSARSAPMTSTTAAAPSNHHHSAGNYQFSVSRV